MAYNFAPYQAATYCSGSAQPGTLHLSVFLEDEFPKTYFMNIYSCREIYGGSGHSHHAEGRAEDLGVPTTSTGAAITSIGMPVIELLGPHGRELGIDHMIYNRRIWAAAYPQGRYYAGAHPHRDHWHIGLTRIASSSLTISKIRSIVYGEPVPPAVPIGDDLLPLKRGERREDVRMLKDRLNETFSDVNLDIAGADGDLFDFPTEIACRNKIGQFTGHPEGKAGRWVGANQWNQLERLWQAS